MQALKFLATLLALGAAPAAVWSAGQSGDPTAFRSIYEQLIEIDTTLSSGSCTDAAQAMADRLKDAGMPDGDIHVVIPPQWPRQGNLVATHRKVVNRADRARRAIPTHWMPISAQGDVHAKQG